MLLVVSVVSGWVPLAMAGVSEQRAPCSSLQAVFVLFITPVEELSPHKRPASP